MSTRCKACNMSLSKFDFSTYKSDTLPEWEDLCSVCRSYSYNEDLDTHEYQHSYITENWVNFTLYDENT